MSNEKSETDIEKLKEEANKLKALAELYSYLGDIEEGFENLQKETGKLMLAENANENFEAYYKFVLPVSKKVNHIKTLSQLSRSELRKYQGLSSSDIFAETPKKENSTKKEKKADRKPEKIAQSTTPYKQLERRIEELEFNFRMILSLLIALFVVMFVSLV